VVRRNVDCGVRSFSGGGSGADMVSTSPSLVRGAGLSL
jgi:hypothetical protein